MPLVTMNAILRTSVNGFRAGQPFGVGAFNANNMEQAQSIVRAAKETGSPVIIQVSRGALKYSNRVTLANIVFTEALTNPEVPIALHLDHGNSFDSIKLAIDLGFTSVMRDGSLMEDDETPASWKYNVEETRKAVEYAHRFGVTVEGELGTLGGLEEGRGVGEGQAHVTKPEEVSKFVAETGVDALAIAIGTKHGAFKGVGEVRLAFDVLEQIRREHPDLALVLHGASSVPQDIVAEINAHGGNVQKALGVPIESLKRAIQLGVNKINVDTDIRLAMTAGCRSLLTTKPEKYDMRDWMKVARERAFLMIKQRMIDFGSARRASEVVPAVSTNVSAAVFNFFKPFVPQLANVSIVRPSELAELLAAEQARRAAVGGQD
jgi:fructose-bisphosphate aldolase class II